MNLRKNALSPTISAFLIVPVLLFSGCQTMRSGADRARIDFPTIPVPVIQQQQDATCGAAALASVVRYWGIEAEERAIIRELGPPPDKGYSLAQLREWARARDLAAFVVEGDADFLQEHLRKGRPLIVPLQLSESRNHIVVVTGVSSTVDYFSLMDPDGGAQRLVTRGYLDRRRSVLGHPVLVIARAADGNEVASKCLLEKAKAETQGETNE